MSATTTTTTEKRTAAIQDLRLAYYQAVIDACRDLRTAMRCVAGVDGGGSRPVCVVADPDSPEPEMTGESYNWTTPSGLTEIRHPGAYRWPMWYHPSSREVEVDVDWLAARMLDILRPAKTYPCHPEIIGPAGEDDRVQIVRPRILGRSREGMLICDRPRWWDDATVVQVVVRDSTTGERHHLTVPPRFCRPLQAGETWTDRIHDALAWTFDLRGDDYSPAQCA